MIFTEFNYFSECLGIQNQSYILLPEMTERQAVGMKPIPTLYLLHGLSGDHTGWMRMTNVQWYARKYHVAIVMPAVNRSFYMDMAHGAKYFTFISQELPQIMESYFPLSREREGRFAAGQSMGGYGAMKLGLTLPDRYAAVGNFSGPMEMQEAYQVFAGNDEMLKNLDDVYGSEEALRTGGGNLRLLAEKQPAEKAPRMYMSCGTQDDLFSASESFVRDFGEKFSIDYRRVPGGHSFDVWDPELKSFLEWLPLERLEYVW